MASKSELYIPVKAVPIPSETIQGIEGEENLVDCLFLDSNLSDFSLGVISDFPAEDEKTDSPISLVRVSSYHRRSFELRVSGERTFPWEDEFGNLFTNFNLKGNDFGDLHLIKSDTAPSGYAVYGLQDSDALLRVVRASRTLRSQGIDTEFINRVILPSSFPHKDETITPEELKRRFLLEEMRGAEGGLGLINSLLTFLGQEEISESSNIKAAKFLQNTEFVLTVRTVGVSERLKDITFSKTKSEFTTLMQAAFDYVNFTEKLKKQKAPEYQPLFFSADSKEDIERYLTDYLPEKLGNAFSKMHNSGLVHRFPHAGNISIAGGIYDLDSVKGEPLNLGDEEIKTDEISRDISDLSTDALEVFNHILWKKYLSVKKPDGRSYDFHKAAHIMHQKFTIKFLETYLSQAEKKPDALKIASELLKIWDTIDVNEASKLLDNVFSLGRLPSLDFKITESKTELMDIYDKAFLIGVNKFLEEVKNTHGAMSEDDIWGLIYTFTSEKFTVEQFMNEYAYSKIDGKYAFDVLENLYGKASVETYKRFLAFKEARRILKSVPITQVWSKINSETLSGIVEKYAEDKESLGLLSKIQVRRS